MNTYYFTFGQTHVHSVNGFTWDKDVVCAIMANDVNHSREIMFEHFGDKWGMQYITKPSMEYFPRGLKYLDEIV